MEEWRPIEGFPNYAVSDTGRVMRLVTRNSARAGNILKAMRHNHGYTHFALCRDGKLHRILTHRLVATAFLVRRPEQTQVNHRDGVKDNNSLGNLEWCTPSENGLHAAKHGLLPTGERCPWTKMNTSQVREARALAAAGVTHREVAARFGVSQSNISSICSDKTRTHES